MSFLSSKKNKSVPNLLSSKQNYKRPSLSNEGQNKDTFFKSIFDLRIRDSKSITDISDQNLQGESHSKPKNSKHLNRSLNKLLSEPAGVSFDESDNKQSSIFTKITLRLSGSKKDKREAKRNNHGDVIRDTKMPPRRDPPDRSSSDVREMRRGDLDDAEESGFVRQRKAQMSMRKAFGIFDECGNPNEAQDVEDNKFGHDRGQVLDRDVKIDKEMAMLVTNSQNNVDFDLALMKKTQEMQDFRFYDVQPEDDVETTSNDRVEDDDGDAMKKSKKSHSSRPRNRSFDENADFSTLKPDVYAGQLREQARRLSFSKNSGLSFNKKHKKPPRNETCDSEILQEPPRRDDVNVEQHCFKVVVAGDEDRAFGSKRTKHQTGFLNDFVSNDDDDEGLPATKAQIDRSSSKTKKLQVTVERVHENMQPDMISNDKFSNSAPCELPKSKQKIANKVGNPYFSKSLDKQPSYTEANGYSNRSDEFVASAEARRNMRPPRRIDRVVEPRIDPPAFEGEFLDKNESKEDAAEMHLHHQLNQKPVSKTRPPKSSKKKDRNKMESSHERSSHATEVSNSCISSAPDTTAASAKRPSFLSKKYAPVKFVPHASSSEEAFQEYKGTHASDFTFNFNESEDTGPDVKSNKANCLKVSSRSHSKLNHNDDDEVFVQSQNDKNNRAPDDVPVRPCPRVRKSKQQSDKANQSLEACKINKHLIRRKSMERRRKFPEETECEEFASMLAAKLASVDPQLSNILVSKPKSALDHVPSLSNVHYCSENSEDVSQTSQLVTKSQTDYSQFSEMKSGSVSLDQEKIELENMLVKKIHILSEEKNSIERKILNNDELGTEVLTNLSCHLDTRQANKFLSLAQESEKVMQLIIKLSNMLARAEVSFVNLPDNSTDKEKAMLHNKTESLKSRLNEAKSIKESVDGKYEQLLSVLHSQLPDDVAKDLGIFFSDKSLLMLDAEEVGNEICLAQTQLHSLRSTMNRNSVGTSC